MILAGQQEARKERKRNTLTEDKKTKNSQDKKKY